LDKIKFNVHARSQKSEVRSQKSEVRSQKSEVRSQQELTVNISVQVLIKFSKTIRYREKIMVLSIQRPNNSLNKELGDRSNQLLNLLSKSELQNLLAYSERITIPAKQTLYKRTN